MKDGFLAFRTLTITHLLPHQLHVGLDGLGGDAVTPQCQCCVFCGDVPLRANTLVS